MLIGLDRLLTPDLLHALAAMGHGDRIVLVDANYPATRGRRLIALPGADAPRMLRAVLSLLPIDTFVRDPAAVMQVVGDPAAVPPVVAEINDILQAHGASAAAVIDRHRFYAEAETAYAIVQTGERRFYGNVMLTKGTSSGGKSMSRYVPPGPLGMGGAPLGNLFDRIPEDVAAATVQAAWDAGIRHYDNAPHYGAGLSEHRMGPVLRLHPRDMFALSTKIGRILEAADNVPEHDEGFVGALPFRRRIDYSAAGTYRSIEDSLQRMGLSRIDIVYIHDVSADWHGPAWTYRFREAMEGAAKALTEMRRAGVIRAWGLGVNVVEPCLAALEQADPDLFLVAGRYTLLDHTALERLFPACAAKGVRVVLGGPYNSGLLAGGTTFNYETAPPELAARAKAIGAVCARHGVDLKAAALQFCAAHPVVATVIPGARTPAEVQENARMMVAPIPGSMWVELREKGLIPENAPTP